jgi:hypothetical protein
VGAHPWPVRGEAQLSGPRDTGVCGSDLPPLVGDVLTGSGLTVEQAAAALARGEEPPLTPLERRIVEEHVARGGPGANSAP